MKTHYTHCALRLGDNLQHLGFLRKLAVAYPSHHFVHYAHGDYLPQLTDLVCDLPNLKLRNLDKHGTGSFWEMVPDEILSHNAWKNAGGYWERHPLKLQYAEFFIDWFKHLAGRMGLESPIQTTADLLFNYPALKSTKPICDPFDVLVINSRPMSNQAVRYDVGAMTNLVRMLAERYMVVTTAPTGLPVTCTQDDGMNVTQIGQLSQLCRYIVMVSTGPSWPTFNIWNVNTIERRVIIIDSETIGLSKNTVQVATAEAAHEALMNAEIL